MSIFGAVTLPSWLVSTSQLYPFLFLTLLIMGIGYMIVPRFRNIPLVSARLAYASFLLILKSIVLQSLQTLDSSKNLSIWVMASKISGIALFIAIVLLALRIRPKLLGLSDYFIFLSCRFNGYQCNLSFGLQVFWC
jgi:hypothetical protein